MRYIAVIMIWAFSFPAVAQIFSDSTHWLQPATQSGGASAASVADVNNDGFLDIYVSSKLYLNDNGMAFSNRLASSGITSITIYGGVFGDYDNDGYLDFFQQAINGIPGFFLYRNRGNLHFQSRDIQANLMINLATQGSSWIDFDLDGKLDLFVGNDFGNNQLFRNDDYASFSDMTSNANITRDDHTYGVSWSDINRDGYPDFAIAACEPFSGTLSENSLYLNNGNGTFADISLAAGVNDSLPSWGIVWFDYDNDDDMDLYITNTAHPPRLGYNLLYRNNGDLTFTDVAEQAGVRGGESEGAIGVAAADFDNDGWQDLYIANFDRAHRLYRNNGDGSFSDIATAAGIIEDQHNSVAVADFNNDGWIDVFTGGRQQNRLMLNNGGSSNWIKIKMRGITANRFAIGSSVTVYTGDHQQRKEVRAGDSFCSQNDQLTLHFGLGAVAMIDSIVIEWPTADRNKGVVTNVAVNQEITIVEDVGINQSPQQFTQLFPADSAILPVLNPNVEFRWNSADDPEADEVTYRLFLSGFNVDTVYNVGADTSWTLPVSNFVADSSYQWVVDATDGYSIRSSGIDYQFSIGQDVSTGSPATNVVKQFVLKQNFPNPFNPQTIITIVLPEAAAVELEIYSISGQLVTRLLSPTGSTFLPAGSHSFEWNGLNRLGQKVASGIYVYRLRSTDGQVDLARRMLLIR